MKKILMSAGSLVFAGALVISATGAFFSDVETSTGNTFTAGSIDLKIDSVSHYNGMVCTLVGQSYVWIPEANVTLNGENQPVAGAAMDEQSEWTAFNDTNPAQFPEAGTPCTGTWPLADLGDGELAVSTFFDFDDIKPGDEGENTISIHVEDNDAWMCASLGNVAEADNGQNEPEDAPDLDDDAAAELDENLNFFAWLDDGDNIFEAQETPLGGPVSASDLQAQTWALADSTTGNGPIEGDVTNYIGVAWCAGDMTVNGTTITCDGAGMGNEAQTDSWSADLAFYVEQSRNNEDFVCEDVDFPDAEPIGALLTEYTQPACNVTVDDTGGNPALDTIAEGIAAASPTQTVCVEAGTYAEDVVVNKDITLAGDGAASTFIIGQTSGEAGAVVITADGATVQGFDVTEATGGIAAVRISGAHTGITINSNEINAATGGNALLMDGGQTNHVISNNVINGVAGQPIAYVNGLASVNVASNNVDFLDNTFGGAGTVALGQEASNSSILRNIFGAVTSFTDVEDWEGGNNYNQNNFNDAGLNLQHSENANTGDNGITDAQNNWWGDTDASDGDVNPNVDVDFEPEALAAFPQN